MDNAVNARGEIRSPSVPALGHMYSLGDDFDALSFLFFLDFGWGNDIDRIPGQVKSDYLLGIGPGIRYQIQQYLIGRLDWGLSSPHFFRYWWKWKSTPFFFDRELLE